MSTSAQEATGVSVCESLNADDYVFDAPPTTAMSSPKAAIRKSPRRDYRPRHRLLPGRAGTFHVAAPDVGIIHTSAIVGGSRPRGRNRCAAQVKKGQRATVVFFGDGAMEEGVFYEALNIAKLWQLPMIFWMENNYRRTGRGAGHAATELTNVPKALQVETTVIDGIDVGTVHKTAWRSSGTRAPRRRAVVRRSARPVVPGNAFAMPKAHRRYHRYRLGMECQRCTRGTCVRHTACDPILHYFANSKAPASARAEIEQLDAQVCQEADDAALRT